MTRIGPKIFASRTRPAISPPDAPKTTSEPQERDLVELNTGRSGYALRKAALNAGEFLLKNTLPFVGAAVAGPVGLAVGALATAGLEYLDRPGQSPKHRIAGAAKKALLTTAMASGLGLFGMLSPALPSILQTGAAALGTLSAGVLEFGAHKTGQKGEVHAGKLASEYKKRAGKLLAEAGHPDALKKVGHGFSLSKEARRLKNQIRLVQTALIVNHHLGPAAAVALAGDIGRERVDTAALTETIDKFYSEKAVSKHQVEGVEVRRVNGLAGRDRSMASALYDLILVDAEYHPDSKDPKTDFILGHELSHVKWNDSSATLAQDALEEAVESVFRSSGSNTERQQLAELADDLQQAQLADSRRMENRADQEGLRHALKRGHSGPDILRSATEIFGEEDSPDAFQPHPNGAKRVAAIRRSLETEDT